MRDPSRFLRKLGGSSGSDAAVRQRVVVALVVIYTAVVCGLFPGLLASAASDQQADFFILLDSAEQLVAGATPYEFSGRFPKLENPNLNHPAAIIAMTPLTVFTPTQAFWVWTAANAAALTLLMLVLLRESRGLAPRARPLVVALILTSPGLLHSLQLGQVSLFLALGVALMWRAVRSARWSTAGVLFGTMVVLKPFLLPLGLLFLRRSARAGLVTGPVAAVAISALALPVVGFSGYRAWISTLGHVGWYGHPMNASLTGLVHRVTPAGAAAWVAIGIVAAVIIVAAIVMVRPPEKSNGRTEWEFHMLSLVAILASPLGWLYYTPMLFPLAVTLHNNWTELPSASRTSAVAGGVLLWVPYIWQMVLPTTAIGAMFAGTYTYGMVALLIAVLMRTSSKTSAADPQQQVPADVAQENDRALQASLSVS